MSMSTNECFHITNECTPGVTFVVTDIPVPTNLTRRGQSYEDTFISHFKEDHDDYMSDESDSADVDYGRPSHV